MVKISGLWTVMTIVFIKYRLLNGHRVEGMESFLACLGANMFWRVTIPYKTSSLLLPCDLYLEILLEGKCRSYFKMIIALDNAVKSTISYPANHICVIRLCTSICQNF